MRLTLVLAAVIALMLGDATAQAGRGQESMFQDDNELVYVPRKELRRNLDTLQSLGVDRLRITVLWKLVAPASGSRDRPERFDATDPGAYPRDAWDRYDAIVQEAAARGLKVNFNITGPSPLWANERAPREDIVETFEPSDVEYSAFVVAVGRRYSGTWPATGGGTLPRVSYWSVWNEPNQSGWLTPQWSADSRTAFARGASLYRELLDGAWAALQATGHGEDTILIGETAPKGDRSRGIKRQIEMMTFFRALYCVDGRYRALRGAAAVKLGCPSDPRRFRELHPALFSASGYAHHPYELILPPSFKPLRPEWVTIANLGRLTRGLDRVFRRYGSRRRLPIYLTEYGYQTNPPDPTGVPLARQALYLNQSEYMSWRNPRVRTLSQFLLVDDDPAVPASFQSGLIRRGSGSRKPSFGAYRLPVWLPRPSVRRGRAVRVWALLRPAVNGLPATAEIQHRPRGSKRWRRVKRVTTRDRRNYLMTSVRVRRSGHLRVRFTPPGRSTPVSSRAAAVRIR